MPSRIFNTANKLKIKVEVIFKIKDGRKAVFMEEKDLERNLDNLLCIPHRAEVYIFHEGWSSTQAQSWLHINLKSSFFWNTMA
jgi:hypothetical protein